MTSYNGTYSLSGNLEEDTKTGGVIWFFAFVFWFCIAGNIFIIIIIKKTPTLQSYTGTLLISQTLSDAGLQLVSFFIILPDLLESDIFSDNGQIILTLIADGFRGIASQTLAVTCMNLFFAICHSATYRKRMSKRLVSLFVPTCWIFNILLGLAPLASEETLKSLFISYRANHLPLYKVSNLWVWIAFVTSAYVIPAIITAFAFVMIRRYSRKVQRMSNVELHYHDKYKLSQIITGISCCYIGLWSLMHLSRALQAKYEISRDNLGIFRNISLTAYFINVAYDAFKLPLYMWIYKPIRDTTIQLFRSSKVTRVVTIDVTEAK